MNGMDIMNRIPQKRYEETDDLLAFISIYDDDLRFRAYRRLLNAHHAHIRNRICVEAGCGLGIFAEHMARLGARKVYAVEINAHLCDLARERLRGVGNIEVIHADISDFRPPEYVDVLVHEYYGQLLFDEELFLLERLRFRPGLILPDGGALRCGVTEVAGFDDPVVGPLLLQKLDGVLVSGLLDEGGIPLLRDVARFEAGVMPQEQFVCEIADLPGDLLYFGVEVQHQGHTICRAGRSSNWAFSWTYRSGNRFSVSFPMGERSPEVDFQWI